MFSYLQFVTPCLPLSQSVSALLPVLKALNYFPVTFSFADAVLIITQVLRSFYVKCSTVTQQALSIGLETWNNSFLNSF